MSIIVAGSLHDEYELSSVEILHEDSKEWQTGPELPFGIDQSQMVLVGGHSPSISYPDTFYQLPHTGQDAVWTDTKQKLVD
jgi:hypothetical protein